MRSCNRVAKGLLSLISLALVGCGSAPTAPMPMRQLGRYPYQAQSAPKSTTPAPAGAPGAQADPNSAAGGMSPAALMNNPALIWIKQTYPQTAAQMIDSFLSPQVKGAINAQVEDQRNQLRTQALGQVAQQFQNGVQPNLPQGLNATINGPRVSVSGITEQFGQDISVAFAFVLSIDNQGMIWIKLDPASVKASSPSVLVDVFGGNLQQKVMDAVTSGLDVNGPPNVPKNPGLTYIRGGTFRIDPGFAFINMVGH